MVVCKCDLCGQVKSAGKLYCCRLPQSPSSQTRSRHQDSRPSFGEVLRELISRGRETVVKLLRQLRGSAESRALV